MSECTRPRYSNRDQSRNSSRRQRSVLLQQDGKLNIDDPVRNYIPELADYGSPLTIRHLLTSSGLRDWETVVELTGWLGATEFLQDEAVDIILRQTQLDFVPGTEYSYSNRRPCARSIDR